MKLNLNFINFLIQLSPGKKKLQNPQQQSQFSATKQSNHPLRSNLLLSTAIRYKI